MKPIQKLFVAALAALAPFATAGAQEFTTPAVSGYGKMVVLPEAKVQPDPEQQYKLLYSVNTDDTRQGVSGALWSAARMANQLHAGGVPKENIDMVFVFSGKGIAPALDEETHQARFGKANPHLEVMKMLRENGATFYACGQTIATNEWTAENLNDLTTLASSAMMVVANYQLQGYALMQL